jgi:hypothetical protein
VEGTVGGGKGVRGGRGRGRGGVPANRHDAWRHQIRAVNWCLFFGGSLPPVRLRRGGVERLSPSLALTPSAL